jgi:hypothetical protein
MRNMNIAGWQPNYGGDIYGCYLDIHNDLILGVDYDLIVWADDGGFTPSRYLLREPLPSFIIAEKLKWREVPNCT